MFDGFFSAEEAIEVVATLFVSGWAQCDCANGSWLHRVVVFLMCLHVLSEFYLAVRIVVDRFTRDDGSGTDRLRDPMLVWEGVCPKNTLKYHLDDHARGVSGEGRRIVSASCFFFDRVYAAFDIWDALVFSCDV